MDVWQQREDRLRPPSPMVPWPESGPLDDPYFSDRQHNAGIADLPRFLAPWERRGESGAIIVTEVRKPPPPIQPEPVPEPATELLEAPPPAPIDPAESDDDDGAPPPTSEATAAATALLNMVWDRARDCNLTHTEVAQRVDVSLCHLSNIQSGRRDLKDDLRLRLEQFLKTTQPTQGTLF